MNLIIKLLLTLLLVGLLSACAAEPTAIDPGVAQTGAAQTAAADPTATATPQLSATPTGAPIPTLTLTPTATFTPTPTASPTPDLRVIDGDPHGFLLSPADLPAEARYYLPYSNWLSPNRNTEILFDWGTAAGQAYLEATGRVDGWVVNYLRGTTALVGPEQIFNNAVLYRTSAGAQLVIDQYTPCSDPGSGYVLQQSRLEIGDITRVCLKGELQPSGQNRIWYRIEFTYRNFYHAVVGHGWELEVRPEFVEAVARTLFAKLVAAPLVEGVTFVP